MGTREWDWDRDRDRDRDWDRGRDWERGRDWDWERIADSRDWGLGTGDWESGADSGQADSREPSAALSAAGLPPDIFFIKEHTDNDRQKGSCRCGHAHGVKGGREEEGGGIGAGDADSEDGNHIVDEGEGRFPAG